MIFVKPPPFFGELPAEIDTITTGQELCSKFPAAPGWRREPAERHAPSKHCPRNADYNLNLRHCKLRESQTKHILNKMPATEALRHIVLMVQPWPQKWGGSIPTIQAIFHPRN